MMWVNQILQDKNEDQLDMNLLATSESRGPRKHEVVFTTDVRAMTACSVDGNS